MADQDQKQMERATARDWWTGVLIVLAGSLISSMPLMGQFIIDPYRFTGAGGSATVTLTDSDGASSYVSSDNTFTGLSIGAAEAGRVIVVALCVRDSTSSSTQAGLTVTVAGNATTKVQTSNFNSGGLSRYTALAWATVATGTTATVVVNMPSADGTGSGWLDFDVFRLTGVSATALDNAGVTGVTNPDDVTLTTVSGGIVVAAAQQTGAAPSASWTAPMTEASDRDTTSTGDTFSTATAEPSGASTNVEVEFTNHAAAVQMHAVSFEP